MQTAYEKMATEYLQKALNTPWECTAKDVEDLAVDLRVLAKLYAELQKKYDDLLIGSIHHMEVMSANQLKLLLQK